MPSDGILSLFPVRRGVEDAILRDLNALGNDIRGARRSTSAGEPRIEFPQSQSIHFARLTLLEDPRRGSTAKRLLLATDFDGPRAGHLAELHRLTRHPEALWGRCEGYEGAATFEDFVVRHLVPPQAHYIAFRHPSLDGLRAAVGLREAFDTALAAPEAERTLTAFPDLRRAAEALFQIGQAAVLPVRLAAHAVPAVVEGLRVVREFGLRNVVRAALQISASLDRVPLLYLINRLFRNRLAPPAHPHSEAHPGDVPDPYPAGFPPEDAVLQNQLTLVTDVMPDHLPRLRSVLSVIDLYSRHLAQPGSLVGISTIHSVRWALLDDGTRLLMVSNYDGTWENYIDEFAEMILSGLNALWTSAPDFPKAGAQDVAALKRFLRLHQAPASAFYSAYPASSVLNLRSDLAFARALRPIVRRLLPPSALPSPDPAASSNIPS